MSKIKFCGLRRPQDIQFANACAPEYAGFVFAPSKRQVTPAAALKLREQLHPAIQSVGVFVNHSLDEIVALYKTGVIGLVQLHGNEPEQYVHQLQARCPAPVIRAIPVNAPPQYSGSAPFVLFDTPCPQNGGSGQAFNWNHLAGYQGQPYFLAGGLHSGNVAQAIATLHPYCVDVSSGIETNGYKDFEKMQAFITQARALAPL